MKKEILRIRSVIICTLMSIMHPGHACADKQQVRSFDIFDTLVGRVKQDPESTLRIVEEKYNIQGLQKIRSIPMQQPVDPMKDGFLDLAYAQFQKFTNLSDEQIAWLRDIEFQTELDTIFPIQENINKVKDGDILVSDTFYTKEEIQKILEKIGFNKNVELFCTASGKYSGVIWPSILEKYHILSHFGDNIVSDVENPRWFGIKTEYFDTTYTKIEKEKVELGHKDLADLMRTLRLSNPYEKDSLNYRSWEEQSQINVPILIQASCFINEVCKKFEKNKILFQARDCCHLVKIFQKLFPDYESVYFYCSQECYKNASKDFLEYVHTLYDDNTILIDGLATGRSCTNFFKNHLGKTPFIVTLTKCPVGLDNIIGMSIHSDPLIEFTNLAMHGRTKDVVSGEPILYPLKFDVSIFEPSHNCIALCLDLLRHYNFKNFDPKLNQINFNHLYSSKCVLMDFLD